MSNTFKHQLARKIHKSLKQTTWKEAFEATHTDLYTQTMRKITDLQLQGAAGYRYGNKRKGEAYNKVHQRRVERKKLNNLKGELEMLPHT